MQMIDADTLLEKLNLEFRTTSKNSDELAEKINKTTHKLKCIKKAAEHPYDLPSDSESINYFSVVRDEIQLERWEHEYSTKRAIAQGIFDAREILLNMMYEDDEE